MDLDKLKLNALTGIEPVIAGRRLRPFSAGTLQLCRRVELKIATGQIQDVPRDELERELVAFFFIHAFPLDLVRDAVALPRDQFFALHIDPLMFEFPARAFPPLMAFVSSEFAAVEAVNVDAVPGPGMGSSELPPPNT